MRRYALSLVLLVSLIGLWEVATPLLAAPDEPQHLIKAAAVARGQWIGREEAVGPRTHVHLPASFGQLGAYPRCFAFHPHRPASCTPPVTGASGPDVDLTTTAGRYPPVYYAVVGLPTLGVCGVRADRAARVLSGLLCALLLAAAATWAAGDLLALAMPLAVTPMVLFLGAVVNPSGVEVAAAAASWVGLLRLATDSGPVRPGRALSCTAVLCALELSRPISVLWVLLIAGTVGLTSSRDRLGSLIRQRSVQLGAAVVALVAVVQTAWVVLAQSTRLFGTSTHVSGTAALHRVLTVKHVRHLASQMVGRFGWLDIGAPRLTVGLWATGLLLAVVVGFSAGGRRVRIAIAAGLVVTVLAPALIEAGSYSRIGYWWQGRYTLPYAIGLPFLATIGRAPRIRRPAMAVAGALALGQVDAFTRTLARYTVGTGHGLGLDRVSWHPPLAPVPLLLLFSAATVCWTAWCGRLSRPGPGRPHDTPAPARAQGWRWWLASPCAGGERGP